MLFLWPAFALLAACSANPWQWDRDAAKNIDEKLAADIKAARPAVPREVSDALLPGAGSGGAVAPAVALEPRFDLSVNNAPVRQVILGMMENTPYSAVLHPEVGGNVSLTLKNATVPEAMEALRRVYGYDFRREGNRYLLHGRGMQTRLFPVNYLNFERRGRSDTRIVTGELTQFGSTSSGGSGGATGSGSSPTSGGQQAQRQPAGVRVETESKVDLWKNLRETMAAILGCDLKDNTVPGRDAQIECKNGRMVAVNAQASLIVARGMPEEMRMVEDYLGITQEALNRQVILEAKIIEVELNDGFQTGINWSALGGNTTFGVTGGGTIFNSGVSEIAGNTGILNPSAFTALSNTNTSAFGGVFSALVQTADFTAFVELLKSQGNVHVLSSPRVSTVNNQKAVIKVGGDEFFVTSITGGTAATATTAATSPSVTLTPFFSGIALDVTPQIDEAHNIILHIHPSVSEVQQQEKTFRVASEDFILPLAFSNIRESDNVVRALNGQIVVIGGLMKEGATDQDAGIPLLGDIPVLGNAFKHRRVTRIKKELVILLKPTIVENGMVWEATLKDSQGRMDKLKR
jgi:MSHA biogenesis protein MshL